MHKIAIPLGIIFGAIAAFLVWQRLDQQQQLLASSYYLALNKDGEAKPLFAGEILREEHLSTLEVPAGATVFGLDTELILDTPDNRTLYTGKKVNATIPPGRVLTYDLFEDISADRLDLVIPKGKRAISINVSTQNSLNNRVVPGNRIDILGVAEPTGNAPPKAVMILEDVRVLAVGKALSFDEFQKDPDASYGTITIEVTPAQAETLAVERRRVRGEFVLLLRNQCDTNAQAELCG